MGGPWGVRRAAGGGRALQLLAPRAKAVQRVQSVSKGAICGSLRYAPSSGGHVKGRRKSRLGQPHRI